MADLDLSIAGRAYRVACADGEEAALTEAAGLVAAEAETLRDQLGPRFATLPESRVLLMAGLMLADRLRAERMAAPAPGAEEDWLPEDADAPAPPQQAGLFEDPAQTARIAELEALLAIAQTGEAAALTALEEAAGRVRTLAAELRGDDEAA